MAKTVCLAKKTGQVKIRGEASVEWYDDDEKPHYYCRGYFDCSNEELLPVCKDCVDNVIFAQRDLEQMFTNIENLFRLHQRSNRNEEERNENR